MTRRWWLWPAIGVGIALLVVVMTALVTRQPKTAPTSAESNTRRADYAALYDTAWRQDEGQGSVLVTATLMLPRMIDDLHHDTGRSVEETQLDTALQTITSKQVGIFVTLDSAAGALPDTTIQNSAHLTADGLDFTTVSWTPFIGTSHVVNTDVTTSYQSGLLIFSAPVTLDWSGLRDLQLTMNNVGGQPARTFSWAQPGLLQSQ